LGGGGLLAYRHCLRDGKVKDGTGGESQKGRGGLFQGGRYQDGEDKTQGEKKSKGSDGTALGSQGRRERLWKGAGMQKYY